MRRFLVSFWLLMAGFAVLSLALPVITLELTKSKYLAIMGDLERGQTGAEVRALFDREYSFRELLDWEHERLVFTRGRIERHNDPLQIIEYGKGRCGEFAILYVALTLAHGYQSRIVVDAYGDHAWAEVWLNGKWTHIDPSEKRVDDPLMYSRDWGKNLRLVLAFSNNTIVDVTSTYRG